MPMDSINEREAEIGKIAESADTVVALQKHLKEVVASKAFKGSLRSEQFLRHIVEQAIAGHFETLKERVIGAELFGRSPSYDTGQDSIVRVTANDVRKRLLQHYDRYGTASEFRIILPQGSYIPEIRCGYQSEPGSLDANKAHHDLPARPAETSTHQDSELGSVVDEQPVVGEPKDQRPQTAHSRARSTRQWLSLANPLGVLNLALLGILLYGIVWQRSPRTEAAPSSVDPVAPVPVLPWSTFFGSPNPTHLITSDPDIYWIQLITGSSISVSDYANHLYIPEHNTLTPEMKRICLGTLRGDKAATIDTQIAANVQGLAQSSSKRSMYTVRGIFNFQT
jgi:hypothetical protein